MLVQDLNPDERPLARLEKHGAECLSDAELLSILFGGQTSFRAARRVLRNGLAMLPKSVMDEKLTLLRRARLIAFLELARRMATSEPAPKPVYATDYVAQHLMVRLGHKDREHFGVILLDAHQDVIGEEDLFRGTRNNTLVSPADILRVALLAHATSFVVYHNHPSGDPTPSDGDLSLTVDLRAAATTVGVDLRDHLIVSRHRYYSLRDHGQL